MKRVDTGSMLFSRPGKEPLGGCNVTPFAQEKVDGSTLLIDGAIEVDPLAFDFDVGFIHTPGVAEWPCVMIPALFKLRDILLHPPKNSRMGQSDATFRHHLDEVTAQFKCDVPSHTQNDDLLVKVPTLEQILCRGRFRHPGSYRRIPNLRMAGQLPLPRSGLLDQSAHERGLDQNRHDPLMARRLA